MNILEDGCDGITDTPFNRAPINPPTNIPALPALEGDSTNIPFETNTGEKMSDLKSKLKAMIEESRELRMYHFGLEYSPAIELKKIKKWLDTNTDGWVSVRDALPPNPSRIFILIWFSGGPKTNTGWYDENKNKWFYGRFDQTSIPGIVAWAPIGYPSIPDRFKYMDKQ